MTTLGTPTTRGMHRRRMIHSRLQPHHTTHHRTMWEFWKIFDDHIIKNFISQSKDDFGSDPFAALHAPPKGSVIEPDSPSPALPPKAKGKPPRPAPPRPSQGPKIDSFGSSSFANFDDFDNKVSFQFYLIICSSKLLFSFSSFSLTLNWFVRTYNFYEKCDRL